MSGYVPNVDIAAFQAKMSNYHTFLDLYAGTSQNGPLWQAYLGVVQEFGELQYTHTSTFHLYHAYEGLVNTVNGMETEFCQAPQVRTWYHQLWSAVYRNNTALAEAKTKLSAWPGLLSKPNALRPELAGEIIQIQTPSSSSLFEQVNQLASIQSSFNSLESQWTAEAAKGRSAARKIGRDLHKNFTRCRIELSSELGTARVRGLGRMSARQMSIYDL